MLNLWQKNEVFVSEVIQPLFDLANPISELSKKMDEQASKTGAPMPKSSGAGTKQGPGTIQVASMANMAGASQSNQILAVDTQVSRVLTCLLSSNKLINIYVNIFKTNIYSR